MAEIRVDSLPPRPDPAPRDTVEMALTAHDRRRVRRRLTAPDGTEFLLELPTGTVLHVGQPLHVEGDRAWVVAAAPEDVLVARPADRAQAAAVGHMIGNLHRDIDIHGDEVVALWDETLERRLRHAGVSVERASRPFLGRAPGEHSH